MKKILLLVLFCFSLFTIRAQIFEASPNPLQEVFERDLSSEEVPPIDAHVEVVNISSDFMSVKWVVEVSEAPEEWTFSVCDNNFCFLPGTLSNVNPDSSPNVPLELNANDTTIMDLRVSPNQVAGSAKATIKLYNSSKPDSVLLTIDYDVTIDNISPTFFVNKPKLKVFPNPTTEFFQIQNDQARKVDEIVVYNLLGRQVRSFQAIEGRQYSLFGLPDGIYLVGLINKDKGVIKTLRLYKRSLRP